MDPHPAVATDIEAGRRPEPAPADAAWRTSSRSDAAGLSFCVQARADYLPQDAAGPASKVRPTRRRTGEASAKGGTPVTQRPRWTPPPDTTTTGPDQEPPATSRAAGMRTTPVDDLAEARTTLSGLDPRRRTEVMDQASVITGRLIGREPSVRDQGGSVPWIDRAALLVAATIARSGRESGEIFARALALQGLHGPLRLLVPRVAIDSARVEVARATLDMVVQNFEDHHAHVLNEAWVIIERLAGVDSSLFATKEREQELDLVLEQTAAEILWSGHQSAEDLAAGLLGLPRPSGSGARSGHVSEFANAARNDTERARMTLALMPDVRAEQLMNEAGTLLREATARTPVPDGSGRGRQMLVAAELARSGHEAGSELAHELIEGAARTDTTAKTKTPRSGELKRVRFAEDVAVHALPAAETMRIDGALAETRVGMVDDRTVALWLPGSPPTGPAFDVETLTRLGRLAPEDTVLVIGEVRDGRVMAGDQEISMETLAAVIAGRAPGSRPFLLMSGGASVAEPLSRALGQPVLATPHEVVYDAGTGDVLSRRPGDTSTGTTPVEDWFRIFSPDNEDGQPAIMGLFDSERKGWSQSPLPLPPDEPQPPQPVITPITPDPIIRSIGVPRAGLPQLPALLDRIRTELDRAEVRYQENELSLLAHRLLANYPYLMGDDDPGGTNGLQVPLGNSELLISLNATDPHTVNNPAGSTLTPSALPEAKDEAEHRAIGTINATYATGAHVQTQSGQTGASRFALSLKFGVGLPGPLLLKVGGGISVTTNQSNRNVTHIADAEGGHVEDNRSEGTRLVAYTPSWSFKLRTDPTTQEWARTPVHRLDGQTDERLLLWIPKHYLETPAEDQVTATGDAVRTANLPSFYFASGLTNIPRLFDEIVKVLREEGLELPMGSLIRRELLQKLWNLNAHLDTAVNTERGYGITLHNEYGRPLATVAVHSRRLPGAKRVGATSDGANIENVSAGIDGSNGSHSLTGATTLTFPSVEVDLLPDLPGADVGLGISTSFGYTSANVDGLSAGRVGLNVMVPRNTSHTNAYDMTFEHRATVRVRTGIQTGAPRPTRQRVTGKALVRMPEATAYDHGFSVDRQALKQPPPKGQNELPHAEDAIRGTGAREGDPDTKPVPKYVEDGKGIGMGLVMVADTTVGTLQRRLKTELRRTGFLPAADDKPFPEYSWYGHGDKTDSLLDNLELVEKMISSRGLDSHYDQIRQDGMTFTLRKRRGGAGVTLDADAARVTITATPHTAKPPRFIRSTNEYHTVNLAMGMDSAGMSTSHSRKVGWEIKVRGAFRALKAALIGWGIQRISGAMDSLNMLNNRPELLEYPGVVDEFALTSDYRIRVEYQHSNIQGGFRKGRRDPAPIDLRDQTARAFLLPLGNGTEAGPWSEDDTSARVLDQGVVYFLDSTGVAGEVRALGDLLDPAGSASSNHATFTGNIELRSHLKEILNHEYTDDHPFRSGWLRDTFGAMDVRGRLGKTRFNGATKDKFVLGIIKLWLSENRLTDSSSTGFTWDQLDVAAGGEHGPAKLTYETDLNRHWQYNRSKSGGRTGGKELIQLDFNRAYAFESEVSFTVRSRREKHSKVLPSGTPRYDAEPQEMTPRTVLFLLSEPEALTRYAEGSLPLSDAQLKDAMLRWRTGRLKLSGDLAAKILMRWKTDAPSLPKDVRVSRAKLARVLAYRHETGASRIRDDGVRDRFNAAFGHTLPSPSSYLRPRMPDDIVAYAKDPEARLTDERLEKVLSGWRNGTLRLSGDVVANTLVRWRTEVPETPTVRISRDALAGRLAALHRAGGVTIDSREIRERFNQTFRQRLAPAPPPYEHMRMPEYLARDDPGGRILGHHGVHDLDYDNGRSTYDIVRAQIERVAPGMLTAGAEIWDRTGRQIGRMQGGVNALQSIFARGRDQAMWEDVLARDGYSVYLVKPVGWFLTDVVEVNLADVLTSAPEVHDFKPDTGTEDYGHGYIATAESRSRDGSQAWMPGKFKAGGDRADGPVDVKFSEGHHRGMTRAENAVSEQTVYDWSGHYRVRFRHALKVRVRRLKMSRRPTNNLLLMAFSKWTQYGRTLETTESGTLNLQVPRALAEAGPQHGPPQVRNLTPLPELPLNATVTGALVDDLLPVAKKMLGGMLSPSWYEKMLGAKANDGGTRSSLSLPVLLSRSHVTNHVREATGGKQYKLADGLFIPGGSRERATLWLQGDLFDAQVVGRMGDGGTGTGRYIKHQSQTTVNNSSDMVRGVGEYAINSNDPIHPQPSQPGDPPLPRPDHDWETTHDGSRVTSAAQNSSGTETYRREQHAKELGPTLLVRMRGQFWLEAQKTRHHLVRKTHNVGAPVRSDPVTGDVYVEMFEAQYEKLRAQIEENAQATPRALQERVDPAAWRGMDDAPSFDLRSLLVDAGRDGRDASRAHHGVVSHIRDRAGLPPAGPRSLRLRLGRQAWIAQHLAVRDWAIRHLREDLAALVAAHPAETFPNLIGAYRTARNLGQTPSGTPGEIADATAAMIKEVNRVHTLRHGEDAPPLSLPPEASLLSVNPVYLARDVAHELNAHVRLDFDHPNGTSVRRWVDPAGRIYAFDPGTFDDGTLTADQATGAELWSDEIRREALAYGLGPNFGDFYRTSWNDHRTFEQAVAAATAERRERLRAAHPSLPRVFGRALRASEDWHAEVRRLEQELRLAQEAADQQTDPLTRRLADARALAETADTVISTLRAAAGRPEDATPVPWTEAAAVETGHQVTRLEALAHGGRIRPAYRERASSPQTGPAADQLEQALRNAGEGAASVVVAMAPTGTGSRFIVANHGGDIHWFESGSLLRVRRPDDAEWLYSLDMDERGTLLDLPTGSRESLPEETAFGPVRDTALASVAHHLQPQAPRQDPQEVTERERPWLALAAAMFEHERAAEDEAAPTAGPGHRMLSLSTAAGGPLPADPHLYAHTNGRHGIGPADAPAPGWQRVGPLSGFVPMLWLMNGGPQRVPTASDVVRTQLGAAVRHLSGPAGRTLAQRVAETFAGAPGRTVETPQDLPVGLPDGTWVWFHLDEPEDSTAAVVTPSGYRALTGAETAEMSEQELWDRLDGRPHTIVVARARVGARGRTTPAPPGPDTSVTTHGAGSSPGTGTNRGVGTQRGTGTRRGSGAQRGTAGKQRATAPPDTGLQVSVDRPLPQTPHLYLEADGTYRVSAAGVQRTGRQDLGALAQYVPVSWLLQGGPHGGTTVNHVVENEREQAARFLIEATVTDEIAETVRSLLLATGRTVELTSQMPASLPPDTRIYYTGPVHTGAAVVLPNGHIRYTASGDTTLISRDRSLQRLVGDGRHTIVIARPAEPSMSRTADTSKNEIEEVAKKTEEFERAVYDPDRLDEVLRIRRLRQVDVPTDDNCFFHSLIAIAGRWYLTRHIHGLETAPNDRAAVQVVRDWLADRLQADLAVAAQGLPSRYADYFHVHDNGGSIASQQRTLVNQIRKMDSWQNEAGDLVAHIAANELGLPLTLIQDRYVTPLGPDGPHRISFIRAPGHFRGAVSTDADAPGVPWDTFRPQQPTSAPVAQRQLDVRIRAVERQRDRAAAEFVALVKNLPRDVADTMRRQAGEIDAEFRRGRSRDGHTSLPPHLRARHRLDTMGRAVREREMLNDEIRAQRGEPPTALVPGTGSRVRTEVTQSLVNEVNARLRGFRGDWIGEVVDAREVEHAWRDLLQGPADPRDLAGDLAHEIAFGEASQDRDRQREDAFVSGPSTSGLRTVASRSPSATDEVEPWLADTDDSGLQWVKSHYSGKGSGEGVHCVEVTVVWR